LIPFYKRLVFNMADKDPFTFENDSDDECFQAWSGSKVAVTYSSDVETFRKTDVKVKKVTPCPNQKRNGKMSFLERMRERNSKEPRLLTDLGSSSKSKFKNASNKLNGNPLDKLKCSPAMKKFILSEFKREKVSYNFLPEQQVAMAVIHRYNTYIASLGGNTKWVNLSSKKNNKINQSANVGGNKTNFKKNSVKGSSVGDSGFLDDSGIEEVEIQEFDENDLPIPSKGSFSLNPSLAQLKSKRLLVLYNSDYHTDKISDSSPIPVKITKINSLKRKSVRTGSDQKNTKNKIKRTVLFNSQPQFEPSQGKYHEEKYAYKMVSDYPKSTLRKCPVKVQTVLLCPPVKSLRQHLAILRDGTQEESFKIVTGQAVESGASGNSLKRQASQKLRQKLKEFNNVKLNLDEKLDDEPGVTDITDQPISGPSSRVASTTMLLLSSTPASSPTLDELSSISVCRNIPRRLDFNVEDCGDDDENIIKITQMLKEFCKITNEDDLSLPVASQNIIDSPDSEARNMILDEPVATIRELVPAGLNSERKTEYSGSCPEEENCRKLADFVEEEIEDNFPENTASENIAKMQCSNSESKPPVISTYSWYASVEQIRRRFKLQDYQIPSKMCSLMAHKGEAKFVENVTPLLRSVNPSSKSSLLHILAKAKWFETMQG